MPKRIEVTDAELENFNLRCMITKDQLRQIKEYVRAQTKKHGKQAGPCGGEYSVTFTPTSMITVVEVKHCSEKAALDITDYESF